MHDLTTMSLRDLAAALAEKRITAREIAERALANQRLDAFREVNAARTLRQAAEADAARSPGDAPAPLRGVPLSVKDLFGVPGYQTFAGSPRPLPPRFEAPGAILRAALEQHAVVVGKTHTVEFAFGGVGTNPHHPTPINPWDANTHRAPGGSTAGAGVSLCEGSSVLGLGTDTAGSVRIPAAWTGTCGLKTTRGRWPTDGVVPLSSTLDTVGVLARTVADLAYAFEALDPGGAGDPIEATDVAGLRLGRCDDLFLDECSPGVVEAFEAALGDLTSGGATLHGLNLPEVRPAFDLFCQGGPVSVEAYRFLSAELPSWLEAIDPNVRQRIGDAGTLPASEYQHRLETLRRLSASLDERLRGVDVLVAPTVANTPPRLNDLADPAVYRRENLRCLRNTSIASYLDLCALTLPAGLDAAGMPVGLMVMARGHQESELLAVGRGFERQLGTARQRLGAPPRLTRA